MVHSILQFQEKGILNLEKIFCDYSQDMKKIAEMVLGVKEQVINLGLSMIAEEFEFYDECLRKKKQLRKDWQIVRQDETTVLTSLGKVTYHKTLFKNKNTGKSEYLLDRVMGLGKHTRITEDAHAQILEEAVQTSYRKGGIHACITDDCVSKQSVMKKLHALEFPRKTEPTQEKKVVDYLYLDADEDHVSLQFQTKKGDLIKNENNQKNNSAIAKLVYVYEGIEKEAPESKRRKLIHPHYFCRVCNGKENQKFWDEIYEYLDANYELSKVKKIYLNADGGAWINAGLARLEGITYVLDRFYLEKYLTKLTSHMKDSQEDAKTELREAIQKGKKKEFQKVVERLKDCLKSSEGLKRLEEASEYIETNWNAARVRLEHKDGVRGCSAEGHVSHVLSSRMSSRPMGWSRKGMSKMAELRAYYYNGGDMLELVRFQKTELKKAAGCEDVVYSCGDILACERENREKYKGKPNVKSYSIPYPQIKKIANFKNHIYGL